MDDRAKRRAGELSPSGMAASREMLGSVYLFAESEANKRQEAREGKSFRLYCYRLNFKDTGYTKT